MHHAGLSEAQQRRIRIAARLLSVHGMTASVAPWDGTRCNLLVIAEGDTYGEKAKALALRRETPVLVIGETAQTEAGVSYVSDQLPSVKLLEAIRALLQTAPSKGQAPGATETAVPQADSESALEGLARHAAGGGGDLFVKVGTAALQIRWSSGRVVARSHSDTLYMRERLGASDWSFAPLDANRKGRLNGDISSSLEVFFVRGAVMLAARLPRFPDGRFQLAEWPDLGTAPDLIQSLGLAALLIREALTVDQAAARLDMPVEAVGAHFWAFRAAGLLGQSDEHGEQPPSPPSPPIATPAKGIWSKLARRFGLLSKG